MKNSLFIIFTLLLISCEPIAKEVVRPVQLKKQQKELKFTKFFPEGQKRFKYSYSFSEESFNKHWRKETTKNNTYRIDLNSNSGRFSEGYLITETNGTGEEGVPKRSEFGINLHDSINQTKYLSFSFKAPQTFKVDNKNLGRETLICQWYSKPGPKKTWQHYREFNKFNRPSVALLLTTNDNINFFLVLRYGNNGKPKFNQKEFVWSTVAVRKIERGEWYDLVFEIKWSFTNAGYISAWVNNEPLTPFNGLHNKVYGPNMHNVSPNYFKFGQYRYWDDSNKHELFFDELRVGDRFEEVSLYKNLPEMFKIKEKFKFVKNHK